MVKRRFAVFSVTALLLVCAVVMLSPVAVTVVKSMDGGFYGYIDFFLWKPLYLNRFINSVLISALGAAGNVIVSVFAAYVFAFVKFRGRDLLFYLYIIVMMMPFQVTLLPQYIISREYGIYDTHLSLILPGIFSAFGVFLLTQIIKTVPNDIIEAGRIETGSTFMIITRLVIPNIRSGIACLFVLQFTELWNAIAEPLVLLETPELYPLAVLLGSNISPAAMAAAAIFLIPPLLLYLLFTEELSEGLKGCSLK